MELDMAEIAQLFIEESVEGLDVMESGLLNLDLGAADPETMNAIFRAAHSIKGGGATFGFTEISEFAHQVETLLDEMRQGDRPVTREGVDLLLSSVDCMREMVEGLTDGSADPDKAKTIHKQLEVMLNSDPAAIDDSAVSVEAVASNSEEAADPVTEESQIDLSDASEGSAWHIVFKPDEDLFKSCNDPIRIFRELEELGEVKPTVFGASELQLEALDPEGCKLYWELELTADTSREDIEKAFAWVEGQSEITITCTAAAAPKKAEPAAAADPAPVEAKAEAVEPEPAKAQKPAAKAAPVAKAKSAQSGGSKAGSSKENSSIRVNIDKVDALINLVGELVITQSMLTRFNGGIEADQIPDLCEGLTQLSRNTLELQESVMAIRMMPISFAFSRFPRLVRDQGNALGKKVNLVLSGESTELDKTVLEKIGDPLVHLVRNSLDHGLETPEQRIACGKDEVGTLELNAYHSGGSIVIEVIDDGAGINKEKVIAKARDKGLIGPDEKISDDRANNLIFEPGFSTADQVSDLSGRGVGMDVVRRNISDLGGSVTLKSDTGVGSKTTITLPLTLAIMEGQLLRVGKEAYVVPLISIIETIQTKSERVNRVTGQSEMFELRNEYLPIIRLHELFGIQDAADDIDDGLLVVAEANHKRIGIFVDELLEQQQLVIKSLEANYQRTQGISGATILGDGTVALILDVPGILKMFLERNKNSKVISAEMTAA